MVQRKTARYDFYHIKNQLLQVEAVLACQCRAPMGRQCLTPTSNPPCDVDYTRYSSYYSPNYLKLWRKFQHRCDLRDLWHFTRVFSRHLQGWDRGMSSSSLSMRNSRIPTHMLVDEISYIYLNLHALKASEFPIVSEALYQNHIFQRAIYTLVVKFTRQIIASKCTCNTF